ncbi:decaprenyl-phosphate phosphoribosyltransferase [Chloroflexota bacterium]
MRPNQWYKNLIVFVGITFSLNLFTFSMWVDAILAFICFCLLSGSEYIINDILDIETDRHHPVKSNRPITLGALKRSHAILLSVILIAIALALAYFINLEFFSICVVFFLWTFAYSFRLKHIIIVDAVAISINFAIRAISGCLAINVPVSPWIVVCSFLLALLLVFGKRRHELILLGDNALYHRKTLVSYSAEILEQMISIATCALIMAYSMYTFLTGNLVMMITIPVVIYSILRYVFLIHAERIGGVPEMLFKDKGMVLSIILWVLMCAVILYGIPNLISG